MRRRWWRRREVGSSAALVQGDGTVLRVDPPMVYDVLITPLVHTGRLTREACAAGGCYLCLVVLAEAAERDAATAAAAVQAHGNGRLS
ncbi:hypothetical protein [Mycolicibacterium canariasense]|uniref:hypothetical protein n=1 Tax=Mycolicibacterium canariasense TaxID=228230 RepID=UPI0010549453|nr:hypothetical protein [Mycolicibacterium canariasense]MCV7208356.1 hypothetical protein [Mycolicibacterium canariasense]